jgi:hypothetical protein
VWSGLGFVLFVRVHILLFGMVRTGGSWCEVELEMCGFGKMESWDEVGSGLSWGAAC